MGKYRVIVSKHVADYLLTYIEFALRNLFVLFVPFYSLNIVVVLMPSGR